MKKILMLLVSISFAGCLGYPENIKPVENFELDKYLGKWYEIARLDHSFERGLSRVSAEYSLRDDGGVNVLNKGYDDVEKEWSEADGRAYFVESPDIAYLKVSFFRPFYGSYVVFELDSNYQHAFVTSSDYSYLWFLSRTATVSPELMDKFKTKAESLGFDLNELIIVEQGAINN